MARDGSGTYTLPPGNPVVTLTTISTAWANSTLNDIANEITNSIDKAGRTVPTANLPMGGFRHTGAGAATVAGMYLVHSQSAMGPIAASTLSASGATTLSSTLAVTGAATLSSTLGVTGLLTASGNVETNQLQRTAAGTLTITATDAAGALDLRVAGASRLAINAAGLVTIPNAVETPTLQRSSAGALTITSSNAAGTIDLRVAGASALAVSSSRNITTTGAVFEHTSSTNTAGQLFRVENSNAGTGAFARLQVSNGSQSLFLDQFGTGFSGGFAAQSWIYTGTAQPLILGTNIVERMRIEPGGNIAAGADNAYSLGTPTRRWSFVHALAFGDGATGELIASSGAVAVVGRGTAWTETQLFSGGSPRLSVNSTTVNLVGGSGVLRTNGHISRFESAEQTCPTTSGVGVTVSHGGSRRPDVMWVVLRCVTADNGYAVGDEVQVHNTNAISNNSFTLWASTSQVGFQWRSDTNAAPAVANKSTGTSTTLTSGNWRVVFKCLWL